MDDITRDDTKLSDMQLSIIEDCASASLAEQMAFKTRDARTVVDAILRHNDDGRYDALIPAAEALAFLTAAYDTIEHFEAVEAGRGPHPTMDEDHCALCKWLVAARSNRGPSFLPFAKMVRDL